MLILDGNFEFVLNVDLKLIRNNQESSSPKKYLQLNYNLISTLYYFGLFQLLTFQKSKVWLRNMNFDWLRFNQTRMMKCFWLFSPKKLMMTIACCSRWQVPLAVTNQSPTYLANVLYWFTFVSKMCYKVEVIFLFECFWKIR